MSIRVEANPKWIRGLHRGRTVVDSRRSRFVWEHRYYPQWYFPLDDVGAGDAAIGLQASGETFESDGRGIGLRHDLRVGDEVIAKAAWTHPEAPDQELRDLVRFEFEAIDGWFEEDVEVFVHPRSPEVRVDVLASSRHVVVEIDGVAVADSTRSRVLYETGLPARYYLPQSDIRMDLLRPTDSETACPYKGWASYWTASVEGKEHVDIAWGYRTPLPESRDVAGLVCFYNEKVDLIIDGESQGRPKTKFS